MLVLSAASQVGIACATEIAVHITKCTAVSSERTYDMSSSGARWFCGTAPHRNIPIHSLLLKVLPRICAVAYTKAALHQRTLIITLGTATINSPRSMMKLNFRKRSARTTVLHCHARFARPQACMRAPCSGCERYCRTWSGGRGWHVI